MRLLFVATLFCCATLILCSSESSEPEATSEQATSSEPATPSESVPSNVLDLNTKEEFTSTLAEASTILVEFYAPWCGHCNALAPEYESAAARLKANDPPVPLAKVDCTTDEGKDLCQTYGVESFPTLKIFKGGEFAAQYQGPREADGIVEYMKSMVGPPSKLLANKKELTAAIDGATSVLVVGIFEKDGASELQAVYEQVADKLRERVEFVHLVSAKDVYKIKQLSSLDKKVRGQKSNVLLIRPKILANKLESSVVAYSGTGTSEDLREFIRSNYHGLVGLRTLENQGDFKRPLVVVYYLIDYDKNPKGTNYYRNRVLKVAQNFKDVNFAFSNVSQFGRELHRDFDIKPDELRNSTTPVVTARDAQGQKFRLDSTEFSVGVLEEFVTAFRAGQLEPYIRSEAIPEDNSAPVKVAVGRTVQELVVQSDKDTLIEFYAPWCGHCKHLAPIYDELGAKLANEPNVQIVKLNAETNDVPEEFEVKGYPTLYWYPKSKEVKQYDGGRDLNDFIEFIAKHATEELVGYDREGKPKNTEKVEL